MLVMRPGRVTSSVDPVLPPVVTNASEGAIGHVRVSFLEKIAKGVPKIAIDARKIARRISKIVTADRAIVKRMAKIVTVAEKIVTFRNKIIDTDGAMEDRWGRRMPDRPSLFHLLL
jgi:hypothetical protein